MKERHYWTVAHSNGLGAISQGPQVILLGWLLFLGTTAAAEANGTSRVPKASPLKLTIIECLQERGGCLCLLEVAEFYRVSLDHMMHAKVCVEKDPVSDYSAEPNCSLC
jgi:hypothetical protein